MWWIYFYPLSIIGDIYIYILATLIQCILYCFRLAYIINFFVFLHFLHIYSNTYTIYTWMYAHSIWLYYMLVKYFNIEYFYSWFAIKATMNIFQDIMASVCVYYLLLGQFWLLVTLWMSDVHNATSSTSPSPSCLCLPLWSQSITYSVFLLPSSFYFSQHCCLSKETTFTWNKIKNENVVFKSKAT